MSTNSVIEHRSNYYFVKVCEEYLTICEGNYCAALILSVLEEWTNSKKGKGQSLYIYLTYPEWHRALYGLYARNLIIEAIAFLLAKGLISRRPIRRGRLDTYEYLLESDTVNELLKHLPEKSADAILPNLNAFKKGRVLKSTRPKDDGKGSEGVLKSTRDAFKKGRNYTDYSTTQITSHIDSEREDIGASSLHSDAPSSSSSSSVSTSDTQGETNDDPNRHRSLSPVLRPDHPGIGSDSRDCPVSGTALTTKGEHPDADTALPARSTDRDEPGNKPDTHPAPLPAVPTQEAMETAQGARADALPDASIPAQLGRPTETGIGASEETGEGKKPSTKRARKPSASSSSTKPAKPTPEQMERAYSVLEECWREAMQDPEYILPRAGKRSKEYEALESVVLAKASPARLRFVFWNMWNERDKHDGSYFWRDHMSIKNVCSQYATRVLKMRNYDGKATANARLSTENAPAVFDYDEFVKQGAKVVLTW